MKPNVKSFILYVKLNPVLEGDQRLNIMKMFDLMINPPECCNCIHSSGEYQYELEEIQDSCKKETPEQEIIRYRGMRDSTIDYFICENWERNNDRQH